MTRAPRSAACTTARASAPMSAIARVSAGSSPGLAGAKRAEVCRNEINRAAGATPENPSGPGWPAMMPATIVPWPSQSVRPSPAPR